MKVGDKDGSTPGTWLKNPLLPRIPWQDIPDDHRCSLRNRNVKNEDHEAENFHGERSRDRQTCDPF